MAQTPPAPRRPQQQPRCITTGVQSKILYSPRPVLWPKGWNSRGHEEGWYGEEHISPRTTPYLQPLAILPFAGRNTLHLSNVIIIPMEQNLRKRRALFDAAEASSRERNKASFPQATPLFTPAGTPSLPELLCPENLRELSSVEAILVPLLSEAAHVS